MKVINNVLLLWLLLLIAFGAFGMDCTEFKQGDWWESVDMKAADCTGEVFRVISNNRIATSLSCNGGSEEFLTMNCKVIKKREINNEQN